MGVEEALAKCSSAIDEKAAAKVTTSRNGSLALPGLVVEKSTSVADRDSVGIAGVGRNVGSVTDQERGRWQDGGGYPMAEEVEDILGLVKKRMAAAGQPI